LSARRYRPRNPDKRLILLSATTNWRALLRYVFRDIRNRIVRRWNVNTADLRRKGLHLEKTSPNMVSVYYKYLLQSLYFRVPFRPRVRFILNGKYVTYPPYRQHNSKRYGAITRFQPSPTNGTVCSIFQNHIVLAFEKYQTRRRSVNRKLAYYYTRVR